MNFLHFWVLMCSDHIVVPLNKTGQFVLKVSKSTKSICVILIIICHFILEHCNVIKKNTLIKTKKTVMLFITDCCDVTFPKGYAARSFVKIWQIEFEFHRNALDTICQDKLTKHLIYHNFLQIRRDYVTWSNNAAAYTIHPTA